MLKVMYLSIANSDTLRSCICQFTIYTNSDTLKVMHMSM